MVFSVEVTFASSGSTRSGAKFSEVKLSAEDQAKLKVRRSPQPTPTPHLPPASPPISHSLSLSLLRSAQALAASDGFYRIRARGNATDGQRYIVASSKAVRNHPPLQPALAAPYPTLPSPH